MRKKFFLLIIVCLVMGAGVMAQTSTVSGTVFAEDNNEPIIGASVLVKGTTLGAVTDIEGKFTILNVPGTAKTVIVSFVGMQKVEAAIKPAMKVVLKSDSELLDGGGLRHGQKEQLCRFVFFSESGCAERHSDDQL